MVEIVDGWYVSAKCCLIPLERYPIRQKCSIEYALMLDLLTDAFVETSEKVVATFNDCNARKFD